MVAAGESIATERQRTTEDYGTSDWRQKASDEETSVNRQFVLAFTTGLTIISPDP
jgi:hypothetical protein